MSGRVLGLLALVTALAVGAAWYVRQPAPEPTPESADNRFLPGLADRLPSVTAIRVRVGGDRLLAHVVRDGDAWRVGNRSGYPADRETLRGILVALSEARREEAKTDRAEGWARLGLQPIEDPDAGGVELTLEGLDPAPRILIGETAGGDTGGTYLRRADEDDARAWLVSERIEMPADIGHWLDDRLTEIPIQRMRSVEIAARDGEPVRMHRDPVISRLPTSRKAANHCRTASPARSRGSSPICGLRTCIRPIRSICRPDWPRPVSKHSMDCGS